MLKKLLMQMKNLTDYWFISFPEKPNKLSYSYDYDNLKRDFEMVWGPQSYEKLECIPGRRCELTTGCTMAHFHIPPCFIGNAEPCIECGKMPWEDCV